MAKLERYTQEDLARSYAPLSNTGVGEKGSMSNPYTESEMDKMIDEGTWTGGFVIGLGYVAPEVTVKPTSCASDWHCPNCGLPYPTDGSMKCSNCGTALPSRPGSSSSGGGGGGGGDITEDTNPPANTPIADVLTPSSFRGYVPTEETGCLERCREMLRTVGVETCSSGDQSIFMTGKTNTGRAGAATSAATTGIALINSTLESGKPIVVGVDYEDGSPNKDKVTDHFVVIVGRNISNSGISYHYYDPQTSNVAHGTSNNNQLHLTPENILKGTYKPLKGDDRYYTVTTVRPNQP